jgi:hypothetical protein
MTYLLGYAGVLLLLFGLPLLSVSCFIAGVVRRGNCPAWFLGVAALMPLAYTCWFFAASIVGEGGWFAEGAIWMALAFGFFLWAIGADRLGWRLRRTSTLIGLAMSTPVGVYVVFWIIAMTHATNQMN